MKHEKTLIDCTMLFSRTMVRWPGDEAFQRHVDTTVLHNNVETSTLTMSSHAGTHIDAPRHFLPDDAGGIDAIPLSSLVGPAVVVKINDNIKIIEPEHCATIDFSATPRVLFRTSNSTRGLLESTTFTQDYVFLSERAAVFLVKHGVKLVGIDYLSVEQKGNPGHPVHTTLLQAGIVIVEGIVLAHVPAGNYSLIALPLRIAESDGSPCRVLLSQ